MTEAEWLRCEDPQKLLEWLRVSGRACERRCRLFACACVRRVWPLLVDERSRKAIEFTEKEPAAWHDLASRSNASDAAYAAVVELSQRTHQAWQGPQRQTRQAEATAATAAAVVLTPSSVTNYATAAYLAASQAAASAAIATKFAARARGLAGRPSAKREGAAQCILLRDIFINPVEAHDVPGFAWNNGTIVNLAQAAYDDRKFPDGTLASDRLAVLADALEEAGYADQNLLNHLRSQGIHIRGCWAVDRILGKT